MSTKAAKKDWAFGPNPDRSILGLSNEVRSKSSRGTISGQRSPMLGEGSVPSTRVTRKPRSNPPKAEILEDKPITDDDVWVAIDSFFEENSLTATQIQSFNNFIHFGIPKVIAMNKYVKIEERGKSYQLEFGEHYIKTPRYSEMNQISRTLYPTEALWRNVTYAAELLIDLTITPPSGEASFHPKQFFGYIPVMVKSDLCNLTPIVNDQPRLIELGENIYDQGGYFIITPKGENSKATAQKKVVIPQERAAYNRIFIYNNRKSKPKYSIYAEIRCTPNNFNVATVCMGYCCRPSNKDRISCVLPWIDAKEIPLGIVFQALGINDVKDMALLCLGHGYENDRDALEILNRTLEFSYECKDQETALHFIGEKGRKTIRTEEAEEKGDDEPLDIGDEDEIEEAEAALAKTKANAKAKSKKDEISYARHLLATDLFSHMPKGEAGFPAKAKFLGHMTGYLISVILKRQTPEKRDHFMNKIVITTGTLCTYQFFSAFRKLVNDITSNAISALKKGNTVDIRSTIKAGVVTNTMFTAVNNSMWMAGGTTTKGISQPYDQYNYTAGIANTRKIALATEGGKSVEPRDLHPSHWGIICVTGDTEVVMADGSYCRMNQVNGKPVMSVNPTTLKHEPTGIYNFFSCVPESLLMITDDCGRTIKCTPDHPFLICTEGTFKWRRAKDLHIDDMIVVTVDTKMRVGTTTVKLPLKNIPNELICAGLSQPITEEKAASIARLLGALFTDGHVSTKGPNIFQCEFYVGELTDAINIQEDIFKLGFSDVCIRKKDTIYRDQEDPEYTTKYSTWGVSKGGNFARMMVELGAPVGKKTSQVLMMPEWIRSAPLYVKKEWLSGFQGGDGAKLGIWKNNSRWKFCLNPTRIKNTSNSRKFFEDMIEIYNELGITCSLQTTGDEYNLIFVGAKENLYKYASVIDYRYSNHKQSNSAIVREYLNHWNYIIMNTEIIYKNVRDAKAFTEDLGVTKNQYYKIRSGKQKPRVSPDWNTFSQRLLKEGKMVSRISKILDVPVEPVYDFTTISPNHSFIANGFVTHNCPAETPEGKSAGLTKAMALTSFITIETDPIPVKTIALHLLGDLEEKHHPESTLWSKVFLNGVLIGATNTPNEFVVELVKRRRNADLSIQTSIAYFDIRREIHISTEAGRLCRPLFVVENGELTFKSSLLEAVKNRELTWTKLLATGTIELIDSYEQESKLVAIHPSTVGPDHTHCELHPSLIYGVGGSIIPFLDHNQSPRNTYQCLWIEEPVLMKDLTTKKIKDVKIGDSVVTFHPQTLAITTTKVTHVRIAQTDKRIVKVTTTNNKSIIVTEDHKIMTLSGWKSAGEFGMREYVAMYPEASRRHKQVIFVLVKEVVEVSSVMIADITTKSPNHSFIGGEDFCVHNSAMGKQAIGIPFTNYRQIMTGKFHTLNYVQRPITLSRAAALVGFGDMPAGLNAVVAIISRECNEEDSIEMNQDSIDRGFMESTQWSHYRAEKNDDTTEFFGIPDSNLCAKLRGNFSKLSEEGYPKPGTKLISGDIVIGKYVKAAEGEKFQYINKSIIYEHMWPAVVDGIQKGYTADGYQYLTVSVAQLRTPIEGDKFCYSPDHEVLTMEGWLPITKITKNHKLATLGPDDNLEYHNPTEVVSFAYNGDMIEVETNQVSLKVTPNHNMYVRREIRKGKKKEFKLEVADTLFDKHVHYKKNAEWRCNGVENFILPAFLHLLKFNPVLYLQRVLPIDPWLIFFGIWIAEGWARPRNVEIAVNKPRVKEALIKTLDSMNFIYKFSTDLKIEITDKQLTNYMCPLSVRAINKRLPSWAWKLNKQQCQLLLESMCLGDGHMNGNTPMYDTSSVGLKDDVMRLALHCGWAANAHIKSKKGTHKIIRGKDTVTTADAWRITIVKTQLEPAVNKSIKNQQIKIPYKGKVYCCTVPNHTIYVRRASSTTQTYQKPIWSGNSARHGQKGVIGNKLRAIDLPFTSQGITPDICVNSLALPSRMTIAMLLEIYLGKIAAAGSPLNSITIKDMGLKVRDHPDDPDPPKHSEEFKKMYDHPKYPGIVDATPFKRNFSIDLIKQEMRKLGCEYGDEYMTDGTTGQPLRVVVFQGLAYYQRLKHMVVEKAHARARGGRTTLTRQPKEGRAAGGGLRIGCMERDAILGQGAARFTRDRMFEQSDEFREPICAVCGLYAKDVCMLCGGNNIQTIKIPFGTKLVQQELAAMNIVMRSSIEPYDPPLV